MIAQVKIAPVERWCEAARVQVPHEAAGMTASIDTQTMRESSMCDGRWWRTLNEEDLIAAVGISKEELVQGGEPMLCEHMLEMD